MAQPRWAWTGSWKPPSLDVSIWIEILALTKISDLLTTVFGLVLVDGLVEKNPVGAWLYAETGVLGLVGASFVGVFIVVIVVESAGLWIGTLDECAIDPRHLYLLSYLPLSCVYLLATIHNSVLIFTQLS